MPDRGAKYADKKIAYIDRKLRQTYRQAQQELTKKLNDFNRKFKAEDKKKRQQLADGEITEQEYKDWLARKVFQQEIWENKIKQVEQVMLHHNQFAMQIVNDSKFDVFAENYYSEAFRANWIVQGIGFEVYNTQAIEELLANDPQILPKWKVDKEKDYTWNEKKVNNIITQGIIQGDGVEQITQKLCRDLSTLNENRMRLFARTAMTEAQNAGRQVQMEQAADMGIEINKRWMAVHDSRTRDSHRAMDGEEVPFDSHFSNGLMHPGDPNGAPGEVYNCRCTMVSIYPKYEDRSKKYGEGLTIDGQSYEEWKQGKKSATDYEVKGAIPSKERVRRIINSVEGFNIEPIDFGKHKKQPTTEEIVKAISKYDDENGGGSCSSVALVYIANKGGYDVEDFKDEKSGIIFGMNQTIKHIANLANVDSSIIYRKNDFVAAHKLFEQMQIGKEYYLSVGDHVSIVKRTPKNIWYLELQGKEGTNGYHKVDDNILRWRFGCNEAHTDSRGQEVKSPSVLIDIDTLKNNADFLDIVRYINTKPIVRK